MGRIVSTEQRFSTSKTLHRRLELGHPPPSSNDWAEVEYLHLKDGRTVAGCYLRSQPFRFRHGSVLPISEETAEEEIRD